MLGDRWRRALTRNPTPVLLQVVTPKTQATTAKQTRIKSNVKLLHSKGRNQQSGRQAAEQEAALANHASESYEQPNVKIS